MLRSACFIGFLLWLRVLWLKLRAYIDVRKIFAVFGLTEVKRKPYERDIQ